MPGSYPFERLRASKTAANEKDLFSFFQGAMVFHSRMWMRPGVDFAKLNDGHVGVDLGRV